MDGEQRPRRRPPAGAWMCDGPHDPDRRGRAEDPRAAARLFRARGLRGGHDRQRGRSRSEEHTSELQSLMRISYAVFCLKKKNTTTITQQPATTHTQHHNPTTTLT